MGGTGMAQCRRQPCRRSRWRPRSLRCWTCAPSPPSCAWSSQSFVGVAIERAYPQPMKARGMRNRSRPQCVPPDGRASQRSAECRGPSRRVAGMSSQGAARTRLVELYVERCKQADEYSTAFVAAVEEQGNAWAREARSVMALASEHEVGLNEQLLMLREVHDMQALQSP